MTCTTLCYIERGGKYLMMHRCKNKDGGSDVNDGKWIGVGGKIEDGESPAECAIREIKEETGLDVTGLRFRGVVTFASSTAPAEQMFLFTAVSESGDFTDCREGELHWVDIRDVPDLDIWEGDLIFLDLIGRGAPPFLLKLNYDGDRLVSHELL